MGGFQPFRHSEDLRFPPARLHLQSSRPQKSHCPPLGWGLRHCSYTSSRHMYQYLRFVLASPTTSAPVILPPPPSHSPPDAATTAVTRRFLRRLQPHLPSQPLRSPSIFDPAVAGPNFLDPTSLQNHLRSRFSCASILCLPQSRWPLYCWHLASLPAHLHHDPISRTAHIRPLPKVLHLRN